MRIITLLPAIALLLPTAIAEPVRSGRAQVEWITKSAGYAPGEPVVTALKMTLDENWHTYWINPGEGGMPLDATLELPQGWTADAPLHPFPTRFKSSGLSNFGYKGTVIFPIILHPPAASTGDAEVRANFAWLNCDDNACIPGSATLSLTLKPGETTLIPTALEIFGTMGRVPVDAGPDWSLKATISENNIDLSLTTPENIAHDTLEVFPLTPNIIDHATEFSWQQTEGKWTARLSKLATAPPNIESLELVIHAPTLERPVIVRWESD